MKAVAQKLDDVLASLQPLIVDWQDDVAKRVIREIEGMSVKATYALSDMEAILDRHFEDGLLIFRLFLGLSKDAFGAALSQALSDGAGSGVKAYKQDKATFLQALVTLGLLDAMMEQTNRTLKWSDVLVERLRSGRGSAIVGQKRGRGVEDFVQVIIDKVFPRQYAPRCTFTGPRGEAKCDFAIPSKSAPSILVEAKGYGATGSKMTDVIGDIQKIIAAKRNDTAFLFFTDGMPWKFRQSDLQEIVHYQNRGDITRIYTSAMAQQFEDDLRQLKAEYGI